MKMNRQKLKDQNKNDYVWCPTKREPTKKEIQEMIDREMKEYNERFK